MDFEFTEDQQLLATSVRRYLAERAPISYVRSMYDATAAVDDVWRGLADIGLTAMLVAERFGGAGMGLVDLALPLGELGRGVYPGPIPASAVATVVALQEAAHEAVCQRWLPGIADGSTIGTVAFTDGRGGSTTADARGAVTGHKVQVLDGCAADVIVVAAGRVLVAVETKDPGVIVTPTDTIDGSRKFAEIAFTDAAGTVLAEDGAAIDAARDALGIAMVLDGIGAAERSLELAIEYAKEREQFGKPIGSFQAIQHLCADMLRSIELGRAVGYYAAWACDAADPVERHRAATMARAFAADDFYRVAANAIQIFGGIGFTWEHDIHLYYKRLLTLSLFGGSTADHLEELAAIVL